MPAERILIFLISCAILGAVPARAQSDGERPIGILLAAGDVAKCKLQNGKLVDASSGVKATATGLLIKAELDKADQAGIPARVLALGDLAYESGGAKEFKCFEATWGAFLDRMLPVPGNHEYVSPAATPYFDFFRSHGVDVVKAGKGYYAVNFPDPQVGPWQLIGLNAYLTGKAQADQEQFLTGNLQNSGPRCVLAFWHPPVISSGPHGHGDGNDNVNLKPCRHDDSRKACNDIKTMSWAYRALYARGATAVLAGHDHDFEQFARLDPNRNAAADGIRSFVVGTGGNVLYGTKYVNQWPHEVFNQTSHGILKIEIFPERYSWTFLSVAGDPPIEIPADKRTDRCGERR